MNYYFQKIKDNIWNPTYYDQVLKKPLSSSFKYYAKMSLWLTLVATAIVSVLFLPKFISVVRQTIISLPEVYPSELKVHFNNGQASVNMPEPVVIPLSSLKDIFGIKTDSKTVFPTNLVVIDTRTNFVLADFDNYKSLFVLKKDSFAGVGNDGEVRVSKIPTDNVIISGEDIKTFANKIQSVILFVAPLGVLVIYFMGIFFFLFALGYLIFISLLAWLVLYIIKRDITFKQSLSVTLHACTLPFLFAIFVGIFSPLWGVNFPFLATFTLLIIYLNLNQAKNATLVSSQSEIKQPEDGETANKPKDILN